MGIPVASLAAICRLSNSEIFAESKSTQKFRCRVAIGLRHFRCFSNVRPDLQLTANWPVSAPFLRERRPLDRRSDAHQRCSLHLKLAIEDIPHGGDHLG